MFNKKKLKLERNNIYRKIFKYEDNPKRNLAAAKDALPDISKDMSAPKLKEKQNSSFGSLARDFLKNGLNGYRLSGRGEKCIIDNKFYSYIKGNVRDKIIKKYSQNYFWRELKDEFRKTI